MNKASLGLAEALRITLSHLAPLAVENIPLAGSVDRVAAGDLCSRVESPSIDSSSKDGYAVLSSDVARATPEKPVRLQLAGHLAAGSETAIGLERGTTVRVLTGARIPAGADAVVSGEFAQPEGNDILILNFAKPGQNILPRGRDVASGQQILKKGQRISPGMIGFIAAAGHSTVPVYRNPTVAIVGTGDEIVVPGEPLGEGKLYASNIMTIHAWCSRYGMKTLMNVVGDDSAALGRTLKTLAGEADAIVTSGGAWTGDRDLVEQTLEDLGWQRCFHRIRIGPGKAVGFGMLDDIPVFILPGGPPSNLIGFLEIALPGLLTLAGHGHCGLPGTYARLSADLEAGRKDWTRFFFGRLEETEGFFAFIPLNGSSRLRDMAEADAIAVLPEGQECLKKGTVIPVQLL